MQTTQESRAVYSSHGRHRSYLLITPRSQGGVEVKPSPGDGVLLNSFWQVWLRDLILDSADTRHTAGVELLGRNRVIVTASHISQEGLTHTVSGIAAKIHHLTYTPLRRSGDVYRPRNGAKEAAWGFRPSSQTHDWGKIAEKFSLPQARLRFDSNFTPWEFRKQDLGSVVLSYRGTELLWQVARRVELHFALSVCP